MQGHRKLQHGFTLLEMIVVIAITGILAGMLAALIKGPVQSYVDSAQRADMTDTADTAIRRLVHDVRLALPNSVRVHNASGGGTCNGTTDICYLEYLEMVAGGRYNTNATACFSTASMVSGGVSCLTTAGDLVGGISGSTSNVLTNGRGMLGASAVVVVNNPGNDCATSSVYCGYGNSYTVATITGGVVTNSGINADEDVIYFSPTLFSPSSNKRFQIANTPVTYVCNPVAGTLTRYWGYAIQSVQPNSTLVAPLSSASSAVLATHVSDCSFVITSVLDASAQSAVLVTVPLTISEQDVGQAKSDKLTLYGAAYAGSEAALYGNANGSSP